MNNIFRKSISVILGAALTVTSSVCAFAQDIETVDASSDNWDSSLVNGKYTKLYEEFPMIISKSIGKDMAMTLELQYLKAISESDTVTVDIMNLKSEETVYGEQLTPDSTFITVDNIENDTKYAILVDEEISGTPKRYTGLIETKFVPAKFPINVTLGDREFNYNQGEIVSDILIKKVGDEPECVHEENEPCTNECSIANVIDEISSENLNSFYSSLEPNSYYELQAQVKSEGTSEFAQGFVSTYPDGNKLGIFTRGFDFIENPDESQLIASDEIDMYDEEVFSTNVSKGNFDFSNMVDYYYYQNEEVSSLSSSTEYVIRWCAPQTGSYVFETVGNTTPVIYEFNVNNGVINDTGKTRSAGSDNNVSFTLGVTAGITKVFVYTLADGATAGRSAFRIRWRDAKNADKIPAYRDEVQDEYDKGNFSEVKNDCIIEYDGDVNIFAYNANKGRGYLRFENNQTPLTTYVSQVIGRENGIDKRWQELSSNIPGPKAVHDVEFDFTKAGVRYVDVRQKAGSMPTINDDSYFDSHTYTYKFSYFDPYQKDDGDWAANGTYGDSPIYPTVITANSYEDDTRTLHRGDSDWFAFTTGNHGGGVTARVRETYDDMLYDIFLYEEVEIDTTTPPTWYVPTAIATGRRATKNTILNYDELLPNHTYFIEIARPDSDTYSALYPYSFVFELGVPAPSAVLSENVTLTHTSGSDISDLSSMKNAVMSKMICKLDDTVIDNSVAINDVELYLNNEVLTAATVNSLSAGQYTIVPKYSGVAATGGTVTLTVSEPDTPSDIIEIDLPVSTVDEIELDWLHCARAMANYKLSKEGKAQAALADDEVLTALALDPLEHVRVKYTYTAAATSLFYTNGESQSSTAIGKGTNKNLFTETSLYNKLANNGIAIINLADSTDKTNVDSMHYIIICGINRTTRQIKVYDCWQGDEALLTWVDYDSVFNGGFDEGNANIKFYAGIYEK